MENLILNKEKLPELISKLSSEHILYGPTEEDGLSQFKQIKNHNELNLDYLLTRVSPKSIIFKQTETLFTFKPGRKGSVKSSNIEVEKSIIFAIRPCDARSFSILDPVFNGDFEDPFYLSKRNNTVIIGLTCNKPDSNCFCTSFKDSPGSTENVDLLFTDLDDKYYVEVVTEKGKDILENVRDLFDNSSKKEESSKNDIESQAIENISRKMNLDDIVLKLDKIFDHELWHNTALKCIGCGICTYLCSTCHCFDMQDESTLREGARIRVWDSCMYPEYTLHASGHNPRDVRTSRLRNRVYHKFSYFPKNAGVIACTGCGRCIDYCPVNIDIIDVIDKVEVISNE
ncbi:MAG: 4Fe-4S dicluster domain-containing protein [Candidatus Heimdallarchaeota archaeon]|nr:4Fe-4S dicluster domain-containing protein [Candidatus Heimdallarchaeota archaeon]